MTAVIELSFEPLLQLGQLVIRWQTIATTVALLVALGLCGWRVSRHGALRMDDLLLILVGIVPGAVVGGRLVHVLAFLDAYLARPMAVVDPRVGSLSLLGAVLGGIGGALYVTRLLRAPARAWADIAALPLLLALGLGKVAQLFGGSGQGAPFDGPWAIAFTGAGPWVSANAELPSHPAQLYEALWLLLPVPFVALRGYARRLWWRIRRRTPPDVYSGRAFVAVLAWFLAGRVLVGFAWRDAGLIGPFNAEQLLALAALGVTLGLVGRVIVKPTEGKPRPAAREPTR